MPPAGLWQRMKADPEYAPEHLALEAVRALGPQAAAWVERTRARYPGIPNDTVAQIAVRRFTTFARLSGAAAGATGLPGAVIDIGVLAWTQARMVLHIAAAYDVDPVDPERATDLLVLQNVHKYTQTARTALAVARGHEDAGKLFQRKGPPPQMSQVFLQLGWKLAQMAGMRAAKKMFAKMVPGAAIILGTWANSSATKDLAKKTVERYRRAGYNPFELPAGPQQS
ncbi:EcsC family protein [Virgisporangium ochraceum]|uniref:EcsC family protein n=1 Tax=Virgisporangium ochraceum TaxID=65505 RepID=UPI001EF18BAD|nr:EcsC family protein [Virgisporangium ochraceum]